MLTMRQRQQILRAYEEHNSIEKVRLITGFNYRTIKKYLIQAGIPIEPERERTGVILTIPEIGDVTFESITAAARFLNRRDEEKKRALLKNDKTFDEGYRFKVLKTSSYRRYINYALEGRFVEKFDWRVKRNG